MREYTKNSENQSRTLDSSPRASRQASASDILQAYKNGTLGRQSVQCESIEDEELLQAKTSGQASASVILQRYKESIQRYAPKEEEELLQGKFESNHTSEQEPIQREEKSNNTGLPDNLKSGIENLSGYSIDDVKVHYNSSKPAQLNALAYAQGTDIHVAPGQEKHLPHEAWHVVQQKKGCVQPTMQLQGVNVNDNEGLEKEADAMGAVILQRYYHKVSDQKDINSPQANQAKSTQAIIANQQPIQRRLIVGGVNITDEWVPEHGLKEVVDDIYRQILQDGTVKANAEFLAVFQEKQDIIKKELTKWVENNPGAGGASEKSHPVFGRKQQNRSYANWWDLARALLGWVRAKPMRQAEKRLAEDLYLNPALDAVMNGLCVKLYYKICNLETEGLVTHEKQEQILQELQYGYSIAKGTFNHQHRWVADEVSGEQTKLGHYQRYHRETSRRETDLRIDHNVPDNQLEVLQNPYAYCLKNKVILLHDLMEYFGRHQSWNPKTAGEGLLPVETRDDTMVTIAVDGSGERTDSISISDGSREDQQRARGMGLTTASRDEDAPNTILARFLKLPVWAGQSMTTVRMMKLAQWVGASNLENSALAMSIFAYWRKDYDHRSDFAYHTLFEVLDVAKNFGVFYKMRKDSHGHLDIKCVEKPKILYSDVL